MLPTVLLLTAIEEGLEMRFLATMPETCRSYWHSRHFVRLISQQERSSVQK